MREAARKFKDLRSDTAKMYELVCQQMGFFQRVAKRHDFAKMTKAAADKLVWKKLAGEASQDLSSVTAEVETLKSELGELYDEVGAMKSKCIQMLNDGKKFWQQKVLLKNYNFNNRNDVAAWQRIFSSTGSFPD